MPKLAGVDLEKVTLRLFRGDKDRLQEKYPTLGYNSAARQIIKNHLRVLDEKASQLKEKEKDLGSSINIDVDGAIPEGPS